MFAGIGGFREGLTRAGDFVCVGHCEIDKHADRSYRALFDMEGEWFLDDIRKADPADLPDFDLLCGGFPCQSFSIAGSRGGFDDPRGTLFFELARLAEARHPKYWLAENVPYVQKCIRYIMYTNQICIVPPKNSGERLFVLCSTVHNMFLLAKGRKPCNKISVLLPIRSAR